MTFSKKKSSYTKISLYFTLIVIACNFHFSKNIWDKVFKSGLSKFCGRQPLENLKGCGLLILSNFLKAVFRNIYLVLSWIFCLIWMVLRLTFRDLSVSTFLNKSFSSQKQLFAYVLQNRCSCEFRNIRRKHRCWSLFLTKLHFFKSVTLLKRDSNTGVFLWLLKKF